MIAGLNLFGFTGLYPTFLREGLHYSPRQAGFIASFYGVGALISIAGGWLGDRFSPRAVLSAAFFCMSALGYLCFHGSGAILPQVILTALYGVFGSGIDLRQFSGLSRKVGAERRVQPRLGNVRDEFLYFRRCRRLLDGWNCRPCRMGGRGRTPNFASCGHRRQPRVGSAT